MKITPHKLLVLFLLHTTCESAKILYVMPFTATSHYISQKDLALELAKRGHDVHVITAFKEEKHPPNYHQIMVDLKTVWEVLFDKPPNVFSMLEKSFAEFQDFLYVSGHFVSELVFNSTQVQQFLKEDHHFDLVINEVFFQEALYMFAHKYQAPQVLVTSFGNSFKANYYGRNPLQLATVYHEYGSSPEPNSFNGRLHNFFYCMYDLYNLKFKYLPEQEKWAKKIFKNLPEPVPTLEEVMANVSLVLMNSHFSIDTPTAYLPNFIEVAGLNHVKTTTALPKDLQDILDNARNGVIFLSFGSNVQSKDLSDEKLQAFLEVFSELNETVLMKWENPNQPDIPNNVILRKWFPQRDVVAHPNIKLFIGHGGLLGLQETIAAGVPILGIPVFGDQYLNILQTVENGFGELLEYKNINVNNIRNVLNKMLSDKTYSQKAKQVSIRFKDRPMNGIDTAVWWIEYVIRHKGADFMKSPALNMNVLAYNMLDVYLFVAVIAILVLTSLVYFIVLLMKTISTSKPGKKQKAN